LAQKSERVLRMKRWTTFETKSLQKLIEEHQVSPQQLSNVRNNKSPFYVVLNDITNILAQQQPSQSPRSLRSVQMQIQCLYFGSGSLGIEIPQEIDPEIVGEEFMVMFHFFLLF